MDSATSSERWEYEQCPRQVELLPWCRRAGQICLEDVAAKAEPVAVIETVRDFANPCYEVVALASPYVGLIEDDGGFC